MESIASTEALYVEDLSVGDVWHSPRRIIRQSDVDDFAKLTGDHTPLHGDNATSPFGGPIAHGLLGLSVLAGLSTEHPRVATLALTELSDWKFDAPVFFGDAVSVITTLVDIQPHGRRAARVTWLRELVNQNGNVVQRGHFISLVATRARARKSDMAVQETSSRVSSGTSTQRGKLPAR